MIGPISFNEMFGVFRSRVDRKWLDEYMSTPDGAAQVNALVEIFVAQDAESAKTWASYLVRPFSRQSGAPASGATKATTTLAITKKRASPVPLTMPAGTLVQTPDGHVFETAAALTWGALDTSSKAVGGTATIPGRYGIIPPGNVTVFTPVANGITGAGTAIDLVGVGGGLAALRITTDTTKPNPFRPALVGLYLQVLDVASTAAQGDVGRLVQIGSVTNSATSPGATPGTEDEYAWSAVVANVVGGVYSAWYTGTFGFTWLVLDWDALGFEVTNTTEVVDGTAGMLDALAAARGRARLLGEGDDSVRGRLLRRPEPPSPIGCLRKQIVALAPYAASRHDIKIYEMGAAPPNASDPYAENFPGAMGFLGDLHCGDMSDPATPDGMAAAAPGYGALSPFVNPGLSLASNLRPIGICRWDVPVGLPSAEAAAAQGTQYVAAKNAVQPGVLIRIYDTRQWGY